MVVSASGTPPIYFVQGRLLHQRRRNVGHVTGFRILENVQVSHSNASIFDYSCGARLLTNGRTKNEYES